MDWGVPDWRDPAAYARQFSDRQWWWEFIRRRPDYRELWLKESKGQAIHHDTVRSLDPELLRIEFEMSVLLDPNKSYDDGRIRSHHYPRNWGHRNCDHLIMVRTKRLLEECESRDQVDEEIALRRRSADRDYEAGIYNYTFNLRRPIGPQLKDAEPLLRAIQEELHGRTRWKPEPANWPSYLRVLDARDAKASWRSIGQTLWPGENGDLVGRARQHHVGAIGVRDRFPL